MVGRLGRLVCVITAVGAVCATQAYAAPAGAFPPLLTSGATETQVLAWVEAHIDQEHWYYVGLSDTKVLFLSDRAQDISTYPLIKDWVKWERFANAVGTPPRSEVWRVSVDCKARTQKIVSLIQYAGNNGKGAVVATEQAPSYAEMREVAPQTMGEAYVDEICEQAEMARTGVKSSPD